MTGPIVMVEMDDFRWTVEALKAACPEARQIGGTVVLALLLPESHCTLAGIDPDNYEFTQAERNELQQYKAIAQENAVEIEARVFEYHDLAAGIVHAADTLNAAIVYAHLPATLLPLQHQRQVRHLERELDSHHHELRNFEAPVASEDE